MDILRRGAKRKQISEKSTRSTTLKKAEMPRVT
jgi:hypothetical protein